MTPFLWLLHTKENFPEQPGQIYKPFKTFMSKPAEIRINTQEFLQDPKSASLSSDFQPFQDNSSTLHL